MASLTHKDLLGIAQLSVEDIQLILDTADALKQVADRPVKKVPTLRGKTVINLFFEPSTRTRASFELAEKRLSADTLNFAASTSSVSKGETLLDTARNLESMAPDIIVIRHSSAGASSATLPTAVLLAPIQCSFTNWEPTFGLAVPRP